MLELLLLVLLLALLASHRRLGQRLQALEKDVSALRAAQTDGVGQAGEIASATSPAMTDKDETRLITAPMEEVAAQEPNIADDEAPAAPAKPATAKPAESFENRLGARWTVWVGGLALALGGVFLVRYSIESGLLGPEVRLMLAAVFALLLAAFGEILRRRSFAHRLEAFSNAMIPGVLTAAASVTLLATIYVAYGVYGFIGPLPAFLLLAAVSLATLALSLLHGQALAGLGLAASLVTPALVSTEAQNIAALFGFLSLVWLAANAAARLRRWHLLPILSNAGLSMWVIGYCLYADLRDPIPPGIALLVMIAGTAFLWPGSLFEDAAEAQAAAAGRFRRIRHLLGRRPRGIMLSVSLGTLLSIMTLLATANGTNGDPMLIFVAATGLLASLGAGRRPGAWPALFSTLAALWGMTLVTLMNLSVDLTDPLQLTDTAARLPLPGSTVLGGLTLAAILAACGLLFQHRRGHTDREMAGLWAIIVAIVPVTLATITFLAEGTLGRDWLHGAFALALGLAILWSVDREARRQPAGAGDLLARDILILGAFGAFTLCLHTLTHGLVTTLGVAMLGFAFVLATRRRAWRGLPWAMVAASLVVMARIAYEPTIVGPQNLSTTPVFNALLPGYGVPALLLVAACWLLRRWPGRRALNALQGLAALMGLLTLAILVRHAASGGVLDDRVPTLGEQSIYTLLTIGLSGVLMTLDIKSPSRALRYGSMLAGIIATLNVLTLHLGALNPYFSGENTGGWPLLNLLAPGYLLPALAYAGLATFARQRRPAPYVTLIAITAALLGFAWATLSVRWFWQGENLASWKGFIEGETYTYSVVWLLIGVGLLVIGSWRNLRSLRLVSAGLVLVTVLKVFLIDMANLEGILRALSFIGLGGVLIGIGLFYQRILAQKSDTETLADKKEAADA
ncbi:DUF2339 domain-containing protein [Rhizobium sp. SGZ-381]|uniref:DUF2339 domain-containing protein n=1 Tax=Rhizobium sp. SGZ-381 TaxID=3342800 RepID=UPI003670C3F5